MVRKRLRKLHASILPETAAARRHSTELSSFKLELPIVSDTVAADIFGKFVFFKNQENKSQFLDELTGRSQSTPDLLNNTTMEDLIPKKPYRPPPNRNISKSTSCLDRIVTEPHKEVSNTEVSGRHASADLKEEMAYLDRYIILIPYIITRV